MSGAAIPEPPPKFNGDIVYPYVLKDIKDRVEMGIKKYGGPLCVDNERDSLWDAYQEAIDLVLYLRQEILRREQNK